MEYLKKHPTATAKEVGAGLKITPAAAGYHLTQLRK